MSLSSVRVLPDRQKLLEEALRVEPKPVEVDAAPLWQRTFRFTAGPQRIRTYNGLSVFYRALGALFSSGIKLARGLEILARQAEEPALAEILPQVVQSLWEGQTLSKAMSPFPWIFSPLHVRLIEVGETTGKLSKVLTQIAEYEEKRVALVMKVRSAMSYPAFLFVVSILLVVFGPPYMFGGLLKFIKESHGEIPMLTRVMLGFSNFVSSWEFFVLVGGVAYGVFRVQRYLQVNLQARRRLMLNLLGIPVLGRTLRIVAVCRFARSLAVTMATGISVVQGMKMAAEAADNLILVDRMELAVDDIKAGKTLQEALAGTHFFPNAFVQVVKVGEETGQVSDVIRQMADLYEVEMDEQLASLLAALEPIWMLMMGILIGLISVATMLPIMAMIQHI